MNTERGVIERIEVHFPFWDEYCGALDIFVKGASNISFCAKGEEFCKMGSDLFSIFPVAFSKEIVGEEVELNIEKIQLSEYAFKSKYLSITCLSTGRTYVFPVENEEE